MPLVLLSEHLDDAWAAELDRRLEEGALRRWQVAMLVDRSIEGLDGRAGEAEPLQELDRLSRIEGCARRGPAQAPWARWVLVSELRPDLVERLVRLLDHPSAGVRAAVLR